MGNNERWNCFYIRFIIHAIYALTMRCDEYKLKGNDAQERKWQWNDAIYGEMERFCFFFYRELQGKL